MRDRFFKTALAALMLFMVPLVLPAQDQEQPAPLSLGGFDTQGSVTLGYRFTDTTGRNEKFRELFNLNTGPRVLEFDILGRSKPGSNPFADSYSLTMSGLGGDPFPGGQLTVRKDHVYDLRVNYRQSYYFWNRNDNVMMPYYADAGPTYNLTSWHDWYTTRRFGSANLTVHATNNLRFLFEYHRASRDGVNFTTRELDYFDAPSYWGSFMRSNPYYVEMPLNEVANRVTGGLSYTIRDWNFHYRIGYQDMQQNLNWQNTESPEHSLVLDQSRSDSELLTAASWSEFRRMKTPVSEFSYTGHPTKRLELRGGYIYYRYRGPSYMDSSFVGTVQSSSNPLTFSPYSVSYDSRAHMTEPNHVIDEGFSLKIKDWWNLHFDYRHSRFNEDTVADFHSADSPTGTNEGEVENQWKYRTHEASVNMEFIPNRMFIIRPGIRFWDRDVEVLEDGVIDDARTRNMKSVWPTLSVYFRPAKAFSVRGDFQSNTTSRPYTRISAHTDVGSRFVFRYRPTEKLSVEDNLVIRTRKFDEADFRNNIRSNAFAISYAFNDKFSGFAGFSYDSFLATDFVAFIRGTALPNGETCTTSDPCKLSWRDQTVNRVWQAGISAKPVPNLGFILSGNFVRSTGAGEITDEPPYFGPMTFPYATGTVYYDLPLVGRLAVDVQRTYYIEEIVHGNDFGAHLVAIRWTRDF
jgi:hypothetical protein